MLYNPAWTNRPSLRLAIRKLIVRRYGKCKGKLIYDALDALEAAASFRKAGNIDAALIMRAMSQGYLARARKCHRPATVAF